MTIKKKKQPTKIEIDLTGEQGDVFYLMGMANQLANRFNLNGEKIINDMMSSDYEHAVEVFDEYFGDICILYR